MSRHTVCKLKSLKWMSSERCSRITISSHAWPHVFTETAPFAESDLLGKLQCVVLEKTPTQLPWYFCWRRGLLRPAAPILPSAWQISLACSGAGRSNSTNWKSESETKVDSSTISHRPIGYKTVQQSLDFCFSTWENLSLHRNIQHNKPPNL